MTMKVKEIGQRRGVRPYRPSRIRQGAGSSNALTSLNHTQGFPASRSMKPNLSQKVGHEMSL